jgi:hypothetical protein
LTFLRLVGGIAAFLAGLDGVNLAASELALAAGRGVGAALRRGAASSTALLAGLNGVNLAVGELAGADTLVGLAVLAETVVLC